jgi:GAF domain-containing protein
MEHTLLLRRIRETIAGTGSAAERLASVCRTLQSGLADYDWVGFYLVDPEQPEYLVLGPFAGDPTEHVRIAFGQGICGQAAQRGETFVVDDVSLEANYLSCSVDVRSEIVVPILHEGLLVGELDIDSHRQARFSAGERRFCESVAALLGAPCEEARRPAGGMR